MSVGGLLVSLWNGQGVWPPNPCMFWDPCGPGIWDTGQNYSFQGRYASALLLLWGDVGWQNRGTIHVRQRWVCQLKLHRVSLWVSVGCCHWECPSMLYSENPNLKMHQWISCVSDKEGMLLQILHHITGEVWIISTSSANGIREMIKPYICFKIIRLEYVAISSTVA